MKNMSADWAVQAVKKHVRCRPAPPTLREAGSWQLEAE